MARWFSRNCWQSLISRPANRSVWPGRRSRSAVSSRATGCSAAVLRSVRASTSTWRTFGRPRCSALAAARRIRLLLRVNDAERTTPLTESLREGLSGDIVSVRSWQTMEDRIGRNLETAENYLSLVGFAIVILGGIGVWSVTRVLVQQKIRSVAVLKCLGASGASVLAISLVQILGLAAVGSLVGLGVAALVLQTVPMSVLEPLGVTAVSVRPSAAIQGMAVGLLVSLLFALVPLLDIRQVKPLLLLRAHSSTDARRRNWQSWLAGTLVAASLAIVAMWQADSIATGLYVSVDSRQLPAFSTVPAFCWCA